MRWRQAPPVCWDAAVPLSLKCYWRSTADEDVNYRFDVTLRWRLLPSDSITETAACIFHHDHGNSISGWPARIMLPSKTLLQSVKPCGAKTMIVDPCSNQPNCCPLR